MLNKLLTYLWIKHPKFQEPDTLLTLAVWATFVATTKFLFSDVVITLAGHTFSCGHVDPLAYGAILTPTLGAYTAKKWAPPASPGQST